MKHPFQLDVNTFSESFELSNEVLEQVSGALRVKQPEEPIYTTLAQGEEGGVPMEPIYE